MEGEETRVGRLPRWKGCQSVHQNDFDNFLFHFLLPEGKKEGGTAQQLH